MSANFKQYYEEAMAASNAAGYSGMSAAQTIEAMAAEIAELTSLLQEVVNEVTPYIDKQPIQGTK